MGALAVAVDEIEAPSSSVDGLHARPAAKPSKIVIGDLEIDLAGHRVSVGGARVRITAMQMRLLVHLAKHRDEVVSRPDLLRDVWGYRGDLQTRTVDIHVQRLRDRLGRMARLIATVRGVGYRLSEDPE